MNTVHCTDQMLVWKGDRPETVYGPTDSVWEHKSYKNYKNKITLSFRGVKILHLPLGLFSVVMISSIT